jgi:hypothetical protein
MEFPYSFNVAGVSFEKRCEKIQKYVYRSTKFVLEMEPDNQFDGNAVMVRQLFKSGGKLTLGYVPRKNAAKLTRCLVAGEKFKVSFVVMHIRDEDGTCVGLRLKIERDE